MIRKSIFIAIVVLLIFFLYRGISPSWADKILNNISSLRQKNINKLEIINTWLVNIMPETSLSWKNSYDKLTQSWALKALTWISEKNIITWNTNKLNQMVSTWNNSIKTNTTTNKTQTNTNWLSAQDIADLKNLLNNVVE